MAFTSFARCSSVLVLVLAASIVACGSESDPQQPAPAPQGGQQTTPPAESPVVTPTNAPELCSEQAATYEPQRPATNILFVVDRSGSMHIRLPNGGTRWTATRDALFSVVERLPATNARASVMMFPQGDKPITCCNISAANAVACNCVTVPEPATRCDATTYDVAQPQDLDAAAIARIKASIQASDNEFYWGTPLAAGLGAAVAAQKASTQDGVNAVVILTDGAPTSCDTPTNLGANDIGLVVAAAAAGMADKEHAVRTFVLGVMDGATGAEATLLSKIAVAGGTSRYAGCEAKNDCAYSIEAKDLQETLAKTLDGIARDATDCTFDVPPAATTPDKINVTLLRGTAYATVNRDEAHAAGWDFLPGNTQFKLYGAACKAFRDDDKARVNVVVGCSTVKQ
jgi:hypothetical protein